MHTHTTDCSTRPLQWSTNVQYASKKLQPYIPGCGYAWRSLRWCQWYAEVPQQLVTVPVLQQQLAYLPANNTLTVPLQAVLFSFNCLQMYLMSTAGSHISNSHTLFHLLNNSRKITEKDDMANKLKVALIMTNRKCHLYCHALMPIVKIKLSQ